MRHGWRLDSWGSDFGYELIGSDWTLKYPAPADPQLATLTREIVADARVRMQQLVAALPQFKKNPSAPKYHASSRGGFVAEGGSRGGAGGSGGNGSGPGGWDSLGTNWAHGRGSAPARTIPAKAPA